MKPPELRSPHSGGAPELHYQDAWATLYRADSTHLGFLPPASVQLVVTSPPYNLDMPYGDYRDTLPYPDYLDWVRTWARELLRVAAPSGRLCLNVPLDTNKGGKQAVYADYVNVLREAGWSYQTTIVWNEQNLSRRTAWGSWLSPTAPFVTAPVEMIAVFSSGAWRRERDGRTSDLTREEFLQWTLGTWQFAGEHAARVSHPAPFPEELARRLITLYSFIEDTVLDPFVGSGTTCAVATHLGRKSIGVDIDAGYCTVAAQRCRRAAQRVIAAAS
jgi:site-specific DNA-methyltransferase (adenine-specific)